MYGIFLIMSVVLLSGFISYFGDQIGMKVGKRRISLFGLRPKYTSIIITILTGVLIASFTLTIIFATNNNVRNAIFNIQEVVTRLGELEDQLFFKEEKIVKKDDEIKKKELEIATKEEELTLLKEQQKRLQKEKTLLEGEYSSVKTELVKAQNDITTLENKRDELRNENADLLEKSKKLKSEVDELNSSLIRLRLDYQQGIDWTTKQAENWILGDIVFRKNEVIFRDVIEIDSSKEQTVDNLFHFLEKANEEVKKYPIKTDEKYGTALHLRNEDIYSVTSDLLIAKEAERYIVDLVADLNVLKDGTVYASLELEKDWLVFAEGEFIASAEINGSMPILKLQEELVNLFDRINSIVVDKGLLVDKHGDVGSMDFSQLYLLLRQIQEYPGDVKVKVYAGEDIWRENQLSGNLQFKIKPLEVDKK